MIVALEAIERPRIGVAVGDNGRPGADVIERDPRIVERVIIVNLDAADLGLVVDVHEFFDRNCGRGAAASPHRREVLVEYRLLGSDGRNHRESDHQDCCCVPERHACLR